MEESVKVLVQIKLTDGFWYTIKEFEGKTNLSIGNKNALYASKIGANSRVFSDEYEHEFNGLMVKPEDAEHFQKVFDEGCPF